MAQTKESVLTFSDMLRSPHVAEFQQEVEHWLLRLQELGIFNIGVNKLIFGQ